MIGSRIGVPTNRGLLDARYVNTTGDTMTGNLVMPAESFIGPSNTTGIYFKGGLVGIGTTGPAGLLTVNKSRTVSYPTPGLTAGSIHITPSTAVSGDSTSITFGSVGATPGYDAEAGIYVQGSGDYGTKMYFATTDAFGTGAQARVMIDHLGNVGIGTMAPKATLDFGTNSTTGKPLWLMYNDNSVYNAGIWRDTPAANVFSIVVHSAGQLAFGKSTSAATPTFGAEWMRIDNTGNVGIGTTAPKSVLHVSGSFGHLVVTKTTAYTAAAETVILCNATSAAFAITLPAATNSTDRVYHIKKTDSSANAVTIDGNASETIDGALTQSLSIQYESLQIVCDGSNWHIIGGYRNKKLYRR